MRATNIDFLIQNCKQRVETILNQNDDFEEVKKIPHEDNVGLKNGYSVDAYCLSVDLRSSTKILNRHKNPTVAKIMRTYISEVIAVMNSISQCKYLTIHGDGVIGVYDCETKKDIQSIEYIAYTINSVINLLNKEYAKKGYNESIKVGIGADWSKMLMIKAGYRRQKINEILWIGESINNSVHIADVMNVENNYTIGVSYKVYNNLSADQQTHYSQVYSIKFNKNIYVKSTVNAEIENYIKENY